MRDRADYSADKQLAPLTGGRQVRCTLVALGGSSGLDNLKFGPAPILCGARLGETVITSQTGIPSLDGRAA
ncbi:MAG: hypothetical protein WC655_15895 [Candidatus Hydrogenedentales bacterium]